MVFLLFSAFAFYAWLIHRYPAVLRGGVPTFMILYSHAQTVHIFAQLQLRWPPSVLQLLEILGVTLFQFEMGRPECLIGSVDEDMGGPFYLINMVKFIALIVVFFSLFGVGRLGSLIGKEVVVRVEVQQFPILFRFR